MAFFTDDDFKVIKREGLQTLTGAADLLQWGMEKVKEKPLHVAGAIALFTIAAGSFKFKLSDVLELKK